MATSGRNLPVPTNLISIAVFIFICLPLHARHTGNTAYTGFVIEALDNKVTNDAFGVSISGYREDKYDTLRTYSKFGLSLLVEKDDLAGNDFYGYDISGGIKLDAIMSPYAGIGIMFAETVVCSSDYEYASTCYEESVLGFYPELGFQLNIGRNIFIRGFARQYYLSNNFRDFSSYGVGIGFNTD